MKVAIVCPVPFGDDGHFGGGERYATDLAGAMAQQVETVLVNIGTSRRSERRGRLQIETFPWITLLRGARHNPLSLAFLQSLRSVDVIHCHGYHTLLTDLSVIFGRLTRKKVFITDHGGGASLSLARFFDITRLAHALLLVSRRACEEFPGGQRSRHVIYAGVDLDRFGAGPARRQRRVLYVGRLLPHKGINYLIESVDSTVPLTIVGRPYDTRYYALLRELAVTKDITFITHATDQELIRLYQTAAVSVLPSVNRTIYGDYVEVPELLGLALIEAMACATPVICTDVGSLPEVVTDRINGFVVPPNQPQALRDRIQVLLDEPRIARHMGTEARETVARHFTWRKVVDRCIAAYESCGASPIPRSGRPSHQTARSPMAAGRMR